MEKSWYIHTKRADFRGIAERYGIDPVTARVLRNRDITDDESLRLFLYGGIDDLFDAGKLPDIGAAVALIRKGISEGLSIRIVGDYDIDGVCAAFIIYSCLRMLSVKVDYVIPERIRDGYGINHRIIEEAVSDGVDLILTVDNGIAAFEELKLAKEKGLSIIITDHHDIRTDDEGRELIPECDAAVDPKRLSSEYETMDICGAVVAWKLAELLLSDDEQLRMGWLRLLPFAAIATVGDVMPLTGENRIIVKEGLKAINSGLRKASEKKTDNDMGYPEIPIGLKELIKACGIEDKEITAYHVGFIIGPCINASGRLETALGALELFLSEDEEEARRLAWHLKDLNEERKAMTERGVEEAIRAVERDFPEDLVIVVELPWLHESLAGIVAGRLREHFGKPAFVITATDTEGISKGSGRSVESYHMFEGLQREQDILLRFGGHPMAAGLSIRTADIAELRLRLNADCGLRPEDLCEKIWIDAPMPISYVTEGLITELSGLAPFGNGNPRPLFAEKDLMAYDLRILGKNKNVLRFSLREKGRTPMNAIMFGDAEELKRKIEDRDGSVSVLYSPQINEYNGRREIQLSVLDIR